MLAGATGIGVDSDGALLGRGRAQAMRRGLAVEFAEADAAAWRETDPGHPRAEEIRDWLDQREDEYVGVYRGVVGLAYIVLAH